MARKDGLPKRAVVLLDTYAHQLRKEKKSDDFIASVINGLRLDYWTAMEEALDAGKSQRQAHNHAFRCLLQDLPSQTARDPLRKSCLIDLDYVVLCLLFGLCFLLAVDYFISGDCAVEGCFYGSGSLVFVVRSYWEHMWFIGNYYLLFVIAIAVRSMRIQARGIWTVAQNFWLFLRQFPAEFFTNFRHAYKNIAIVGLCLWGTFRLGTEGSFAFIALLKFVIGRELILGTPFGCFSLGRIVLPPKPIFIGMMISVNCLMFYFAAGIADRAVQLLVRILLIRTGLTGLVLRFLSR